MRNKFPSAVVILVDTYRITPEGTGISVSPVATSALPLLPLDAGVVLPGMTITIALETPEAREAVSAAAGAGDRLVLVPRLDKEGGPGRFASVGTVATVDRRGSLPGGTQAVVVT